MAGDRCATCELLAAGQWVRLLAHMTPPVTRECLADPASRQLLHRGRFGNATVWRIGEAGDWVVKDFSDCPWPVRWTLGVWLARREYRVLRRLQGLPGVPADPFRLDALAFGYRYIAGRQLRQCAAGSCPRRLFERLEALVRAVHERGIVHLDLRNGRNHIVGDDWQPHLIDFQSALSTHRLPASWRARLERVDLSGVYKYWLLHDPNGLDQARKETLLWQLRSRRWWRLRGYRLPGTMRKLNAVEREFLARETGAHGGGGARASQ